MFDSYLCENNYKKEGYYLNGNGCLGDECSTVDVRIFGGGEEVCVVLHWCSSERERRREGEKGITFLYLSLFQSDEGIPRDYLIGII